MFLRVIFGLVLIFIVLCVIFGGFVMFLSFIVFVIGVDCCE